MRARWGIERETPLKMSSGPNDLARSAADITGMGEFYHGEQAEPVGIVDHHLPELYSLLSLIFLCYTFFRNG
jgi:hypothetical protein